jgi:integrase
MSFRTGRDLARLSLPADKSEVFHFDTETRGLSVRLQRAGKPSFVVWYTSGGKRKRVTLGSVAGMTLEDARLQAGEIVNGARKGRDAGAERKQARAAAAAKAYTLVDLIRDYVTEYAERNHKPHTLVDTRRYLERDWKPLHGLPAGDVTRREVSARLLELTRSTGAVGANRARGKLSGCFSWGMRAGLVDHNPTVQTVVNPEASRERVLAIEELAAIWRATDDGSAHGAIVRLLMVTGQRKSEIGGLAWPELDRGNAMIVLSSARTKNGRAHEVPLSRQAFAVLRGFPDLGPRCPFVFGRRGQSPFSGWSRCKERLDERIARQRAQRRLGRPLGDGEQPDSADHLAPWCLHDLRRTFATLAAEHELIEPHVIEAILNHVSGHRGGVAGIYNRAAYREPKRRGLQAWTDWLESVIEGREPASNVVALAG